MGRQALAVTTDVTDRDPVQKLVDAAIEAFGRIDVMINNAGRMLRCTECLFLAESLSLMTRSHRT